MNEESNKEFIKTFTKITETITEPVKQRLAHPFAGSFLISLLFVNWKPILYLFFASGDIEKRIAYITNKYYESTTSDILHYIIVPLSIAFIYTVVLKWVDILIHYCNRIPEKRDRKRLADDKIDSIKNEVRIVDEQRILDERKSGNRPLEELNLENQRLTNELALFDEKMKLLSKELENKNKELIDTISVNQQLIDKSMLDRSISSAKNDLQLGLIRDFINYSKYYIPYSQLSSYFKQAFTDPKLKDISDSMSIVEDDLHLSEHNILSFKLDLDTPENLVEAFTNRMREIDPEIIISHYYPEKDNLIEIVASKEEYLIPIHGAFLDIIMDASHK